MKIPEELLEPLVDVHVVAKQTSTPPSLLTLGFALDRLRRELDPPPPAPVPPPRPGMVRVKCLRAFHDPGGGLGCVRRPGDVFDVTAEARREIEALELAVVVEGEA